ncbi:DNRLRE domain-containing protein [Nocardioides sp. NPDC127503]|uniref:DNRLRE domain-containing protein n=1 Tax=Nocardioides sp. NPDC127503 TaxID=3154516 RepID=UPI00331DF896
MPDATDGQDTSIAQGAPTTSYPGASTITVGKGTSGLFRGLFKFDTSAIPTDAQVYAAQLRLHFSSVHNTETDPIEMRAYQVTKAWTEDTATWDGMNTSFTNINYFNQFLVDDSDSGATSFSGPWKDAADTGAIYGSYSSLGSGTTADTFDWNAKLPWAGLYETDMRYLPGASRGTPTYTATGDQGTSLSVGIDQTATAGPWMRVSTQQHFAPGATARIRMTRQSGSTATAPMADAVRWMEYARAFKGATQRDGWHTYGVGSMVQNWVENPASNFGLTVKAYNESTTPLGGPYYHSSDAPYATEAEGDTRPQLVVVLGQPGPVQSVPSTVHADGPELSWSSASDPSFAQDDDVAEYQIFRGCVSLPQAACATPVGEDFTTEYARNGALKLVGTVPADTLQFRDDTAVASTGTEKASYRYWVVARTVADTQAPSSGGSAEEGRDGTAVGAPVTVQTPQEGRIARIFTASPTVDVADTTLSAAKPTTNLPNPDEVTAGDRTWVQAGNNHATYGDERAVFGFDTSPVNRRVKVTSASFELWKSSGTGATSTYDLHELTSGFVENQATWQRASTAQDWTDGGAYKATAVASASIGNGPDRVTFDSTGLKSTVQGWVDGTAGAPNGLLLKIRDEAASTHRVWFLNSEALDPNLRPRLRVEHLVKNDDQVFEAPTMPQRFVPGTITRVPVTVTNTTDTAWPSTLELTYRWTEPDSPQDITVEGDRLKVAVGRVLEPGESVDLTLPVRTPINSDTGSKRLAYDFYLDLRNTTDGTWWSAAHAYKPGGGQNSTPGCAMVATGLLCQDRYVESATSNALGLEKFGTYTGEETGAGSQVLTNLSSGNESWSYEAISNPSVGPSAFVRATYNSKDATDAGAGWGISIQPGTLTRLGSRLSVPTGGSTNNLMTFVDGDGTGHTYKIHDDTTTPNILEYDRPAGVALELHRDATAPVREQWVFTRPDGTRFFFAQQDAPEEKDPATGQVVATAVDAGLQTAVVDTYGNRLSFGYSSTGDRLETVKDSQGRTVLSLNWDAAGLTSITDIAGQKLSFGYNAAHMLTSLSDTAVPVEGVSTAPVKRFGFTYTNDSANSNTLMTSITDPRDNVSRIAYFTSTENSAYANWPKTFTDRRNKTTDFTYSDPDGSEGVDNRAVVTDNNTTASPGGGTPGSPGDTVTTYRVDGYGRTTSVTDSLQQTTKLGWDKDHNVIRLEEANGAVSTWDYDNRTGYPLTIRDAQAVKTGGAGVKLTYERLPNAPGAPTALKTKTSAAGRKWTFTNDPATGGLKSVADPLGNTTSYTYKPEGLLATATDANGAVTTYNTYDVSGMPTKVTSQITATTDRSSSMTYDPRGNTLTVTDPLNNVSTVEYDGFGRPTKVTTPGDDSAPGSPKATRTTVSAYDLNDNLTSSTAANGAVTTSTYNAADLPTRQALPDNNTTGRAITTSYDDLGQLIEQTAPEGVATTSNANDFVTRYVYNKVGQQIRVDVPFVDTDGTSKTATTTSSYDTVGNLVMTVDPVKNATTADSDYTAKVGYDLNHRPITSTDAKGYVTKTEYDADGLVTATVDPRGVRVRKVYDTAGRPIETHVPHTAWGATSARDQVTKTAYDKVGQVIKTTSPTGRASETIYNLAGEVTQTKAPFKSGDAAYPNPTSTFFEYDAAGRLKRQSQPTFDATAPAAADQWTNFTYFPSGEIKTTTDPHGLATSYLYNQLGQQTQRKFNNPNADAASTRTTSMSYYPDGSVASNDDQAPRELIKYYSNANSSMFTAAPSAAWTTVSNTGQDSNIDGSNYVWHAAAAAGSTGASDTATWKVTPDNNDTYEVRASCPVRADTTTAAVYTINTADGAKTATVNQKTCTSAQKWMSLGTYRFDAGITKTVVLKPSADGVVVADGVSLVPSAAGPSKAYAYTYDRNGLTTEVKDNTPGAKSDTYRTSYDGLGRAKSSTELAGTTTRRTTSYTYDLNSNLTSTYADRKFDADTGSGNLAATRYTGYTYDVRNMVATVATGPQSTSANSRYSYEYDSRGLPVSLTKPNGNRVGYSFYEDRLLRTSDERTSADRGKQVVAAHTLDYNEDGQKSFDVAKLDQAGSTGTLDQRSTFAYTPAGRLASVDKTGADAGDDETYVYDAAGNTTKQTIGAITTTSTFDRDRLSSSVVTGAGTTYSRYDPYGRLISRDNAGQTIERYAYDGFDRTIREQRYDSAGVLQLTKNQSFDPFDRTTSQSTAITGKPTKSVRFTYLGTSDQVAVEEEKNTGGAWEVSKNYAYGPDGSKLQLTDTPVNGTTTKTQYYGTNPHGDIETMTSTDGTTASTYRYTAYGQPDKKGTTGEDAYSTAASETDKMAADLDNVNPYRFSGKRIHGGTGTYDIGFRDYDPGINRFLTRDFYQGALKDLALGTDPWSTNRYAYAGGNPVGMVDLDGHRAVGIDGEECSRCDSRVTQKPEGVADDEGDFDGYPETESADPYADLPVMCDHTGQRCGYVAGFGNEIPGPTYEESRENVAVAYLAAVAIAACALARQACAAGAAESVPGAEGIAATGGAAGGAGFFAWLLGRGERGAAKGGSLSVTAANASASELRAAEHMSSLGRNVELRDPVGARGTATSDLLVDGLQYDVYTPTSSNPNSIIRAIAKKGSQVQGGGVVLDLSQTSVTRADLGDIMARVANSTSRVSDVVVLP